jgi:hypothetical protein
MFKRVFERWLAIIARSWAGLCLGLYDLSRRPAVSGLRTVVWSSIACFLGLARTS